MGNWRAAFGWVGMGIAIGTSFQMLALGVIDDEKLSWAALVVLFALYLVNEGHNKEKEQREREEREKYGSRYRQS